MQISRLALLLPLLTLAQPASAQMENFKPGPVFADFGATAPVQQSEPVAKDAIFKISFDVSTAAEPDKISRRQGKRQRRSDRAIAGTRRAILSLRSERGCPWHHQRRSAARGKNVSLRDDRARLAATAGLYRQSLLIGPASRDVEGRELQYS